MARVALQTDILTQSARPVHLDPDIWEGGTWQLNFL